MLKREADMENNVSGVLVIDKPIGMTSHDVVQVVRRGIGIRRAGHTGTLDPRASGVLVVLVGPAVRISEYVSASDKRYQATIHLGSTTDTYDAEGQVLRSHPVPELSEEDLDKVLQTFVGEIEQVPPPYSAVKVGGRKAYEMAREGEEVNLAPRKINVYSLEILEWDSPELVIDVFCSSGTYVRSLAADLGEKLECGAYLSGLRRTKSGRFTLRDAVPLRRLQESFNNGTWYRYLIPAAEALADWQALDLTSEQVDLVIHGHRIAAAASKLPDPDSGLWARALSEQSELVALMLFDEATQEWQPKKVFFQ